MRRRRVVGEGGVNYYHVMSRVVDRRFIFGKEEKRHFRHLMRRLLAFSGLRCVTFCLMDNHFHLLLEVPDAEGEAFKADAVEGDVFARIAMLYSAEQVDEIRALYEMRCGMGERARLAEEEAGKDLALIPVVEREDPGGRYLQTFLDRMFDLSSFMKELKGVFTQWYNRSQGRKGTLWEERYKSVLCEGAGEVLLTMAAYIDLNPVRAEIVRDPKDYQWSGYGEAVAGEQLSRRGIRHAVGIEEGGVRDKVPWRTAQAAYRKLLYAAGEEKIDVEGRRMRKGVTEKQRKAVEHSGGHLSIPQLLRCRVRHFSEGFAIGGKEFLEDVFARHREHFGARRKSGARKIGRGEWGEVMAMRDVGETKG